MSEEQQNNNEKVVLFPGVVEKLVAKGMEALKGKLFSEAHTYFQQSLQIEPDHPQGRFGLALSLIEQSRLEEAKEVTEKMLKEDIGNYYDILQVHISLLVQLGNYEEVVILLEAIIAEEKLPAKLAESLYHLLHFSRQMIGNDTKIEMEKGLTEVPNELLHMLHSGSLENQWLAIQMLGKMSDDIFMEAVCNFLKDNQQDPVLKSIILQLMKEKKLKSIVEVSKFGRVLSINIENLEDVFHEKFGKDALSIVASKIENENPSLYEVISQICWHYLFAIYPLSPEPLNASLWAAALHKVGIDMAGFEEDFDELEIAHQYNVDVDEMLSCANKVIEIEQQAFKGN